MSDRPQPPLRDLPDQGDDPVVWDAHARTFVPVEAPAKAAGAPAGAKVTGRWYVGADAVGKAPPPRLGGATAAPPRPGPGPDATTIAPRRDRPLEVQAPAVPPPARPIVGRGGGAPPPPRGPVVRTRRRRLPIPKLRWIALIFGALPLLLLVFGWWYASAKFNQIDKVQVADVLSPIGGGGTNYLIVGSDSREAVADAGSDDPNVQPGGDAPDGQRSDTMLVLRIERGRSLIMSVPRDLFVTLADTGEEGRINGAFRGGPSNLIRTIQDNLDIPIHRYVEVDFVTFSSLVDALGGVTLPVELVPNPAFDTGSGLVLPTAGPIEVDGPTALAFVRARNYTEVVDGEERFDSTADLGRVQRQQGFLRAVLSEAGASRNPFTLMRIASSVTGGLRVDNGMSMIDGLRFAWNMGRLDPLPQILPTFPFRTSGGAAVLGLDENLSPIVLDEFR